MRFARRIVGLLSKSQAMLAAWEKPLCSVLYPLVIGSISATFPSRRFITCHYSAGVVSGGLETGGAGGIWWPLLLCKPIHGLNLGCNWGDHVVQHLSMD